MKTKIQKSKLKKIGALVLTPRCHKYKTCSKVEWTHSTRLNFGAIRRAVILNLKNATC